MSLKNKVSILQSNWQDFDADAILLLDMKNIRYFSGFMGSDGALLIGCNYAILMVDGRYLTQAKREVEGLEIYEYRDKSSGLIAVISDKSVKTIGFEPASMNVELYLKILDKLNNIALTPLPDQFNSIRAIKNEDEINCIKKAVEISAQALKTIQAIIKPGISEMDIALELEYKMRVYGSGQASFPTIVASGINSALPHASPGARKLQDGDVLIIDYGATYNNYHSDETWTCVIGHADQKQREVYELVKEAHDRALDALKSGASCNDIDRIARSYIENGGFGDYFPHGTGHGVGLDIHEAPRIAAKSDIILKSGMVVTIEPGIYIPDLWGIRIEDMALIKEDGYDILTKTSKDFKVLN